VRLASLLAGVAMLLSASQVQALSCEEYSITAAYWRHADAPETYVLVHGTFADPRDVRHDAALDLVTWHARFSGNRASARAFDQPFSADVRVVHRLHSAIFGTESDPESAGRGLRGETGLVFLRKTADGYEVETALCVPLVDTDRSNIRRALNCLNGRHCPRGN
jgi:hypothetical protein